MKILRCDRCGHQSTLPQISGTEFEKCGFETLEKSYRAWAGATDVCKTCFEYLVDLRRENDLKRDQSFCQSEDSQSRPFRGTLTTLRLWLLGEPQEDKRQ